MPVPTLITDLDTVANNNSPPGTESAKGNIDNYIRTLSAFIKQNYDSLATKAVAGPLGASGITGAVAKAGDTLTGALNEARATVASAATTADIWAAAGNSINWTGTATTTTFPAAPQAGAKRRLHCAGLCSFTHSATLDIIGNANFTAAVGDIVDVEAITTTTFRLIPIKDNGTAVVVASTLPSQTGNSGKALVTNGTVESWGYPAQLSTATGSAPSYSARAFVNFNGTGTVAIRASGNVSSITDSGVGLYTVNWSTAMPDASYAPALSSFLTASANLNQGCELDAAPTASSVSIRTGTRSTNTLVDHDYVSVIVHR